MGKRKKEDGGMENSGKFPHLFELPGSTPDLTISVGTAMLVLTAVLLLLDHPQY